MRVKCIDNKNNSGRLTLGRIYNALAETEGFYLLGDDSGDQTNYKKERFEVIEETAEGLDVLVVEDDGVYRKAVCIKEDKEPKRLKIGNIYNVTIWNGSAFIDNCITAFGKEYFVFINNEENENNIKKEGIKHDNNKLKPTLLFDDMPLAIREVLRVLDYGAKKYSEGNWLKVEDGMNRYRNACDRHRLEGSIDSHDDESGLLHIAHEATNALMLLELKLRELQDK